MGEAALRFRALDSWRGICALLVAAHHLEVHGFIYWQPLTRNAWLFVDFFFVLSGFVIAHAYGEKLSQMQQIKAFVIRRFGRLWPLHATILAAMIAIELCYLLFGHWFSLDGARFAFTGPRSLYAILTNLFLVQALATHPYLTWNAPAWSISTEFFTYLIFAGLCAVTPSRPARVIASFVLALVSVAILMRFSKYGMRESYQWGLARCLYGFFLGTLAHEAWHRGASHVAGGTIAELIAIAVVVGFITFVNGHAALEYFAPPLFCIAVLVFAAERGFVSRILVTRAPAALGRWSYSIYMVHTLILVVLFSSLRLVELVVGQHWPSRLTDGQTVVEFGNGAIGFVAFGLYLAATVALASQTWRFIEMPGQRFFGALARPRTAEMGAGN